MTHPPSNLHEGIFAVETQYTLTQVRIANTVRTELVSRLISSFRPLFVVPACMMAPANITNGVRNFFSSGGLFVESLNLVWVVPCPVFSDVYNIQDRRGTQLFLEVLGCACITRQQFLINRILSQIYLWSNSVNSASVPGAMLTCNFLHQYHRTDRKRGSCHFYIRSLDEKLFVYTVLTVFKSKTLAVTVALKKKHYQQLSTACVICNFINNFTLWLCRPKVSIRVIEC